MIGMRSHRTARLSERHFRVPVHLPQPTPKASRRDRERSPAATGVDMSRRMSRDRSSSPSDPSNPLELLDASGWPTRAPRVTVEDDERRFRR